MKKNLPFIITMAVFVVACAVVTVFTIRNEPQYVRVIPMERPVVEVDESIEMVNINTASSEELQTLSGIGEVIAERIIEYREQYGYFLYLEEIMEVSGVGAGVFERIRGYIYIE